MPTASPETTNTKTDNTNNGKAINMADFFKPSGIAFDFCDIHNDGNEDEILREGEAFRIPGTPIPNGPVMTVCAETVWDAIDDIRRHWKLLRTDDGFLDAWITEQGENLPERPADEEFEEYDGTEGHEETPAPPAPAPTLPAPPKAPSPARAAVQADLTGQATVSTTPPKAKATGGGTKGQATPGPSRIPRTLHPSVSKHAKAWAGANGIRNGKGEVYTELTPGKLPAEALKGWLDSNPTEHEAFVTSWDPR
jgi:hypothetical protein